MATVGELGAHADRYGVLLTQGTFYTTGMQLANIAVVLPFICAQHGNLWAAALLFPAYSIGAILGNSVSPFVLERSRHLRHLVLAATSLVMAGLLTINGIAAVRGGRGYLRFFSPHRWRSALPAGCRESHSLTCFPANWTKYVAAT